MKIAQPLKNLIEAFQRLPGIGPKTAQRLTFYLLHVPQNELDFFASALTNLKKNTIECSVCSNISEHNPCEFCTNKHRDHTVICIVEQPIDILAIEKSNSYKGVYHVLHGRIDPLHNIRPEDIRIQKLLNRMKSNKSIQEIIFALNPDMEGEATSLYIQKKIKEKFPHVKLTRLAYGLPSGASIEYADELTLARALEGRRTY